MVRPSRLLPLTYLLAGALVVGACGNAGDVAASPSPSPAAVASPSPSPTPRPSPSPTAIDVAAVPDEIDVAYVQAVIDELDRIDSEAYREVATAGELTEGFHARLMSTHTPEAGARQIGGFEEFVGVEGLADPPGSITTEVQRIVSASPECIQAEVIHDIQPILSEDVDIQPEQPHTLKLVRTEPNSLNPTVWAIDYLSWFHIDEPCDG